MALTKTDIPELMLPGLKTEFELAYRSELNKTLADKIATVINTTVPVQKYAWLGSTPPMREFLDERKPGGLSSYSLSIEDKVFESSIAVDRRAIEDDQMDLIRIRIQDLALRVASHRQQIVLEALVGGFGANGYDGVSFFNAAHPLPAGGTYSNRSTAALSATSIADGMSAMMMAPDDQGTPLGIVPDTLVCGPKLQWTAVELLESPVVVYKGNAVDQAPSTPYKNAFHGKLNLLVSPFLSGVADDYWFLLDTSRPIRGVILQQRSDVPVEFSALDNTGGSESAWMRDRFHYGVRARYNVGYGLWQTAYGAIL